MPEIIIAICTRARPKMLGDLLQSCTNLATTEGVTLRFMLVESGPATPSRAVIDSFSAQLPITYVHEARIGIVHARNRAVETFLQGSGDWLGFIDDDEVIDPNWAAAMGKAIAQHHGYSIMSGRAIMIHPPETPKIFRADPAMTPGNPDKVQLKRVTTQNVIFKRHVFAAEGRRMRFDVRLNLSGGEDYLLTHQLTDMGEKIRFVPDAITREYVIAERAGFRFRMRKMTAHAHHRGLIALIRFGKARGYAVNLLATLQGLAGFLSYGVAGIFVLVFNEKKGLLLLGSAMRRLCTFLGQPRIFWRKPADIYAVVQGG